MKAAVVTRPVIGPSWTSRTGSPAPAKFVVEVERCGICGTDLHVVDGRGLAGLSRHPGHEFKRPCVALGAGVTHPGAGGPFVVVDPMVFLWSLRAVPQRLDQPVASPAEAWHNGRRGVRPLREGPGQPMRAVPESVPAEWAPFYRAASCVLHALTALDRCWAPTPLSSAQGPQASCSPACSLWAERASTWSSGGLSACSRRRRFGADRTATSTDQLDRERGWGLVVDATGNAAAIQEGLSLVRRAGTFAVFGVSHAAARRFEISPYDIFKR